MPATLTAAIAKHAAGVSYEALPPEIRERTKLIIFDELACAVIGRQLIAGSLIARFVAQIGGEPEATVIGGGRRVPIALAALANGTAGHADEFDGAHITDGHPGAVIVHAAAAVAEARRTTGRALIEAIALGYDIGTRLVRSVGGAFSLRRRHQVHSDHLHAYGAAVASAKLMGLSAKSISHAAALASGHAGGLAVVFEERRHMSKALSTGHAASAGVSAALLASIGFEGHDNVFDSRYGPLSWREDSEPHSMLSGLGEDHAVMGSNFKFYSAGYPIHAPVEAALAILEREQIGLRDIQGVNLHMTAHTADTVSNRDMPSICVEDMVALAMVHGELGFELAHSSEAIGAPEVRTLRELIKVVRDPELERLQPRGRGAKVVITTKNGQRHDEFVEHPRGHALRGGVGWPQLFEKWDHLLADRLTEKRYASFKGMCSSLDTVEDIAELMAPLEGRRS